MTPQSLSYREKETLRSGQLMRRLIQNYRVKVEEELRPIEVTLAQMRLLAEIQRTPGVSGAQLARACGVTPQSAQATILHVARRGWIKRGKDAANERLTTICLTLAGVRLLSRAQVIKARLEAEAWAGVPLAELRQLNTVLERVLGNLDT